jgi:carboxylesterase
VTKQTLALKNAHLEGDAFYWEGGSVGVLLSHGFTATSAEVRWLAKYLHARGYTVAGPLLPGHGTTMEALNRCRWQDWVASAEGLYQQLASRCQKVVVGGESMGGLLALYLASEHPEAAAVLAYAAALHTTSRPTQFLVSLLSPFVSYRIWPPGPESLVDERWKGYAGRPLKAAHQFFRLQKEVSRRLPSIRQPVLIMQGRLDSTVFPGVPAELAQRLGSQDKEVHWLEKSQHCLLLDQEWELAGEITDRFLQRVIES